MPQFPRFTKAATLLVPLALILSSQALAVLSVEGYDLTALPTLAPAIPPASGNGSSGVPVQQLMSGEGRNGPNTSVVSVPIRTDRGVKASEVKKALLSCFFTGDKERGLTSVTERAFTMIHGEPIVDIHNLDIFSVTLDNGIVGFGESQMEARGMTTKDSRTGIWNHTSLSPALSTPGRLTLTVYRNGFTNLYSVGSNFPRVTYQRKSGEPVYDELGNRSEDEFVLEGLKIELGPAPGAERQFRDPRYYGRRYVYFRNGDYVLPNLRLDTREYVECMKSEIERRAN